MGFTSQLTTLSTQKIYMVTLKEKLQQPLGQLAESYCLHPKIIFCLYT